MAHLHPLRIGLAASVAALVSCGAENNDVARVDGTAGGDAGRGATGAQSTGGSSSGGTGGNEPVGGSAARGVAGLGGTAGGGTGATAGAGGASGGSAGGSGATGASGGASGASGGSGGASGGSGGATGGSGGASGGSGGATGGNGGDGGASGGGGGASGGTAGGGGVGGVAGGSAGQVATGGAAGSGGTLVLDPPGPGITCGGTTCAEGSEMCCADESSHWCTTSASECSGFMARLECDDSADCPGERCCFTNMLSSVAVATFCNSDCSTVSDVQVCKEAGDCANGEACHAYSCGVRDTGKVTLGMCTDTAPGACE